jgi:hypothetical protein
MAIFIDMTDPLKARAVVLLSAKYRLREEVIGLKFRGPALMPILRERYGFTSKRRAGMIVEVQEELDRLNKLMEGREDGETN